MSDGATTGTAFARVDRAAADLRAAMVAYLDGAAAHPMIQRVREVEREALDLRPGERVLDAGCGLGEVARSLAALVGPAGRVDAVDASAALLAEADRRLREAPLPATSGRVRHAVGDVTALAFADGLFDAVRCERVLQHLAVPDAAVAELVRVTRPGGRVSLVDTDWESLAVDGVPAYLAARLRARLLRGPLSAHATMGRSLRARLRRAGLDDVRCRPVATCYTGIADARPVVNILDGDALTAILAPALPGDAELVAEWVDAVRVADSGDQLLLTLTLWVVTGVKPG